MWKSGNTTGSSFPEPKEHQNEALPCYTVVAMETLANQVYARALDEAKSELLVLSHQIDALAKRKSQVEAVIANLAPLLPQSIPLDRASKTPQIPLNLGNEPLWKSIRLSINGKGDSFTVKDALEALERIGRPVESPNRVQIVRSTLSKKTGKFKQIGPGRFAVRNDGEEMEEAT